MDYQETLYYINSLREPHKLDLREAEASVRVASKLKRRGERVDRKFVCPMCKSEVHSWLGKEFLMEMGACYKCEHVKSEQREWHDDDD